MRLLRAKGLATGTRRGVAFVAALVVWTVAMPVAATQPVARLQTSLDAALSNLPHVETKWSACVIDLESQVVVFERYADTPLTPASVMKVFTMTAALAELGPDFAFQTILATDRTNLYAIGDGDPGFGDEKLHRARGESITEPFERWAAAVQAVRLTEIPGDLVIDESIFDNVPLHPSWEPEDLGKWYAAPVGALNLNDNCLDITVSPAGKRDAPVSVAIQPESSLAHIVNKCRSGGKGSPILHHKPGSFEYRISGRCSKRWPFGPVAFPDPGLLFADSLRTVLARNGVAVRGEIVRGRVRPPDGPLPPNLTVIARHTTPLAEVLARAGKDSQNLFAECLLKRTGFAWAKRQGIDDPHGSWALGAGAVAGILDEIGTARRGFVMADGSGLSRRNACTARQLTSILAWSHSQPFGRVLHDSLATAGVDGSLRKRLKTSNGRVHAKTGTMRGIRTLAGFVHGKSGPRFAFAVMFNGYRGPSTPYKEVQDRFCRALLAASDFNVTSAP